MTLLTAWLAALCVAAPTGLGSGGLGGLGSRGKGLAADPKAVSFENELLEALNKKRSAAKLPPLALDPGLRAFARNEARMAAKGDPAVKTAAERIKRQRLAPDGHYLHYAFGVQARKVAAELARSPAKVLLDEAFGKVGIGAFWVPVKPPYFQLALLGAKERDPMAGKPGLSREQTDQVMDKANPKVQACYNRVLAKNPNASGSVMLKIVIGGKGRVDEARLLKGLGDSAFDACMLKVAKALTFPVPYKGKPVTLTHPWRLTPPTGGKRVGRLSPGKVTAALRPARRDIRACYDKRLKKRPTLRGTITLAITVAGDGSLEELRMEEDTVGDEALASCVVTRAKRLKFAAPEFGGSVDLSIPLEFEPHAD